MNCFRTLQKGEPRGEEPSSPGFKHPRRSHYFNGNFAAHLQLEALMHFNPFPFMMLNRCWAPFGCFIIVKMSVRRGQQLRPRSFLALEWRLHAFALLKRCPHIEQLYGYLLACTLSLWRLQSYILPKWRSQMAQYVFLSWQVLR